MRPDKGEPFPGHDKYRPCTGGGRIEHSLSWVELGAFGRLEGGSAEDVVL